MEVGTFIEIPLFRGDRMKWSFFSSFRLTQVAGKKRGPPRFLGYTRSQVLDTVMRSNARICGAVTLLIFPVIAAWAIRYLYFSRIDLF